MQVGQRRCLSDLTDDFLMHTEEESEQMARVAGTAKPNHKGAVFEG